MSLEELRDLRERLHMIVSCWVRPFGESHPDDKGEPHKARIEIHIPGCDYGLAQEFEIQGDANDCAVALRYAMQREIDAAILSTTFDQ